MTNKEIIRVWRHCEAQKKCIDCKASIDVGHCLADELETGDLVNRIEALLAENEHLHEATKMIPEWISVSERLPESEEQVLVTFTGKIQNKEYIGGYLLAEYVPGDGWILEEYPQLENPNVTYWCKLPEPPSTEGVE